MLLLGTGEEKEAADIVMEVISNASAATGVVPTWQFNNCSSSAAGFAELWVNCAVCKLSERGWHVITTDLQDDNPNMKLNSTDNFH